MGESPKHLDPGYRRALLICALLNLAMLFIEGGVGLRIGSAALLADAVDFLEDAAVLGLALAALAWSARKRAFAGLVQGFAMAGVGAAAVFQIIRRVIEGGAPPALPMEATAVLALVVNVFCASRLIRFRTGDASMHAIWLSTRNDALLNIFTVAAAAVIAVTRSGWPDIVAGAIIASVNLWGAMGAFARRRMSCVHLHEVRGWMCRDVRCRTWAADG